MENFIIIPDFEDYMINEQGIIKSIKFEKETILKPSFTTKGYLQVILYKNKERHTVTIHYLMGITFLNLQNNQIIDHKDNNKTNNNLSNLQISDYRHNTSKDAPNKYSKLQGVSFYKKTNKYVSQNSLLKNILKNIIKVILLLMY